MAEPAIDMPVFLVAYDEAWPSLFAAERAAVMAVLGKHVLAIEHVGSTAIPDMAAKPIIDLLVLIQDIAAVAPLFAPLESLGYHYYPYAEDRTPERRWFCKPNPTHRTHHLHLVQVDSPLHRDQLLFRDYLRGHPAEALHYHALKQELAARFPTDREAYTDGKAAFVRRALARARAQTPGGAI